MKKKKLTDPQFKIILLCLVQEMLGKVIYIGKRWDYNENQVFVSLGVEYEQSIKKIRPVYEEINRGLPRIAKAVQGKSLKRAKVLVPYIYSPTYCEFRDAWKIDYSKLLAYSNGAECIRQALEEAQKRLTDEG